MTATDPAAFFRELLGHWEGIANQFGSELMKSGEFARTMQGATSASIKAKDMASEAMAKALSIANMPSREEVVDLAARLTAIEDRLARMEDMLERIVGPATPPAPARPKPSRTRKPPSQAG